MALLYVWVSIIEYWRWQMHSIMNSFLQICSVPSLCSTFKWFDHILKGETHVWCGILSSYNRNWNNRAPFMRTLSFCRLTAHQTAFCCHTHSKMVPHGRVMVAVVGLPFRWPPGIKQPPPKWAWAPWENAQLKPFFWPFACERVRRSLPSSMRKLEIFQFGGGFKCRILTSLFGGVLCVCMCWNATINTSSGSTCFARDIVPLEGKATAGGQMKYLERGDVIYVSGSSSLSFSSDTGSKVALWQMQIWTQALK